VSDDYLRTPPHNIEAEQAIIGGLLIAKNDEIWDEITIQPHNFYKREHQLIFKSMCLLRDAQKPTDIITVTEQLKALDEINEAGGFAYVAQLAHDCVSIANISTYEAIVIEKSIRRNICNIGTEMVESSMSNREISICDLLDEAERNVLSIRDSGSKSAPYEDIKPILSRVINQITNRSQSEGEVTGLETGFTALDRITTGLHPGQLVIVAGRPAMGKTAFAMNIAEHVACKGEKSTIIFSMEMTKDEIVARVISSMSMVDQTKIKTSNLSEADWARVSEAVGKISKDGLLFISDDGALSPMEIRSRSRKASRENMELGLIVVDYLQLVEVPGKFENRASKISEVSRALKSLAKELKVPIIALAQLNRNLEARVDKRPIMSDLKESGAIEQDADIILFIYRDDVYNPLSEDKGLAEIIVGKHRNGPTGMFKVVFAGRHTRFYDSPGSQTIIPLE
jgi:replicative DNA helicase